MTKVTINLNKNVEENAEEYFLKAKKARKKLEGAKKALAISLDKLKKEQKSSEKKLVEIEEAEVEKKRVKDKKEKKEWFEKFRWFISSEGFLVIGGRDATTNEIIIKKHTDKDDIVCHTDMSGSPFFVIKKNSAKEKGKEIGEATIQEAIDATFCLSRAWKLGLVSGDTFWVRPEQVSKEAQAGEYLAKGAFMIRGKTNYLSPNSRFAVGIVEKGDQAGKMMGAPLSAIKTHCKEKEFVEVMQGKEKSSDVAKKIRAKIGGDLDDIIAALPPGGVAVNK